MILAFHLRKWQYYRCSYLHVFAMQSQRILTSTSYPICFLSIYCSTWLLHTQLKANTVLLNSFFWVIPQCLNFICRHFGTLFLFFLPAYTVYEDGTEYSETSANKRWKDNVLKHWQINSNTEKSSKRKNITFRTRWKFQIKEHGLLLHQHSPFVFHRSNNTLLSL